METTTFYQVELKVKYEPTGTYYYQALKIIFKDEESAIKYAMKYIANCTKQENKLISSYNISMLIVND